MQIPEYPMMAYLCIHTIIALLHSVQFTGFISSSLTMHVQEKQTVSMPSKYLNHAPIVAYNSSPCT